MESKGWMSLIIGLALWILDAIRAWWNGLTWRDVLLLLILLGLWGALRELGLVLSRLQELREKAYEIRGDDVSEVYSQLHALHEKVDTIQRTLGAR